MQSSYFRQHFRPTRLLGYAICRTEIVENGLIREIAHVTLRWTPFILQTVRRSTYLRNHSETTAALGSKIYTIYYCI